MLLELLSDFQITIPELGRIEARTHAGRAAHLQQLARADRGAQAPLPVPVARLPVARARARDRAPARARDSASTSRARLVEVVAMVRELDLKKPPSIAESIDWARALLLLGADDITPEVFRSTMSIIVKHRTDLDIVAERVGVKLGIGAGVSFDAQLLGLRRGPARARAWRSGTSELLDGVRGAAARSAGRSPASSARRSPRRSPSRPRTGASSTSSSSASSSAPRRREAVAPRASARAGRRRRGRRRTGTPPAAS